jgi:hypothetical protein
MKTKSTSMARKALASPTFDARQPDWRRVATVRNLQMPANGSNLSSTSRLSGGYRIASFAVRQEHVRDRGMNGLTQDSPLLRSLTQRRPGSAAQRPVLAPHKGLPQYGSLTSHDALSLSRWGRQ